MKIGKKVVLHRIKIFYDILNRNKYISGLKKVILFSAIIHLVMITIYSIIKTNTVQLNYFNILDFDLFFPKMIVGNISQILSIITFVLFYAVIVLIISIKRKQAGKKI